MNRIVFLLSLILSSFLVFATPVFSATHAKANSAGSGSIPQSGLIADIPFTEQTGALANDTTGNGNACTFATGASAPVWNGIGIGFGGAKAAQTCTLPATLSFTARTVAVCAFIPTGTEMSMLDGDPHGSGGGLSYPTLLGATNRSGLTLWLETPPYGSARLYYQQSMYSGYGAFPTGTNDMSIGWNCFFYEMGSTKDSPATTDHLFRNGVETASYTAQGASAALAAASGPWFVGTSGYSDGNQFVGTIEHILAWDRLLSATEVSDAWQSLQTEMTSRGAVFNPPGSQTTNSVLDCLGDSQTAGTVSGATWCSTNLLTLPATTPSNWEINNNAENGISCIAMESGFPAEEALDWSPNAAHSAMMLFCGTNDIIVGGVPAADLWKRQLDICYLAKQAGYEYVTDTTIPSWVGRDNDVQQMNTLIRANWQSCFSSVVDVASNSRLGATGAYTNGDYFDLADPSHLNATGQGVLGEYASNVLASLYGSTAAKPTVVNASYSETAADNFVSVKQASQAVTLTLPSCLGYVAGHERSVLNAGSGAVSVIAAESDLINNSSSPVSIATGKTQVFSVQPLALATSGCTWTTLTLRYPGILVTAPGQVEVGQSITLTAAASGTNVSGGASATPTGTVTFASDGLVLGSAPITNGTASITTPTTGIAPGTYPVTASYSGDANFTATVSAPASVQMQSVETQTTLSATPNPATPPATVALTAAVKRNYGGAVGTPGGRVTFYYGTDVIGAAELNSSGVATFTASPKGVTAGSYAITAQYTGDVYDSPSTSAAITVTVP